MVALVEDLMARGVAYETPDGVYLEVAKVDGYGLLAQQSLESLQVGARVEANEDKRSPLDFALWKKAKEGEPSWDSPWGPGRPGWHTECVVMSLDLLGEGFDLHGGGQDLKFPHHENERAQAVADGKVFARHWMHNGWVEVEGTKMSKSLGNFTTLPDLLSRSDARAYRILVLRAHYRSPIEVTPDTLADAEKALARLDGLARRFAGFDVAELLAQTDGGFVVDGLPPATGVDAGALAVFRTRMDNDLDTPGALATIFELVSAAHILRPTPATRRTGRAWRIRRRCSWRRSAWLSAPRWATWTTSPRGSWRSATKLGGPGTSPGPTPCATSWSPGAGRWRTPPPAPRSVADPAQNPWPGAKNRSNGGLVTGA